ncbi:HNH endonuclease [candidate division WOR-3 bacterium]|nr:HNH endonuclease [candidate division WOR-3 bacterium]
MKKEGKDHYRRIADALYQRIYYKPFCEACLDEAGAEVHHFYPKSIYPWLRYDKDNGVVLCRRCHEKVNTEGIKAKIIKNKGQAWWKRLQLKKVNEPKPPYLTLEWYKLHVKRLDAIWLKIRRKSPIG